MMSGEFAVVPLTVTDSDVGGLVITTGPPMAIDVTVTADSTVTRPLPRDFNVSARAVSRGGHVSFRSAGTGTFRLILTGPSYIQVENLPDEWAVKAITMNGTDITDQAVQPRSGTADVRVILTDRVTEVTGSLSAAAGGSAADARASVVVFPADVSKRRYPSRYLRTVRTDDTGAFRITGLPGNERYLAVAVDHLEDGEGSDPEFLDSIQEKAAPFTLGDSERKTVSIPLVRR
jgi:hypothetical protein